MKYVESGSRSRTVTYTYDSKNNLTSVYDSNRGTTSYAYDEDNRIISVTESDSTKTYAYDAFGRLQTSYISHDGDSVLTQSYGYKTLSATTTSTQLSSYQVTGYSYNVNLSYTYDANGNITSVSDGTYGTRGRFSRLLKHPAVFARQGTVLCLDLLFHLCYA